MDPKKGCSVTLVAAEEGCYSIPITQRPSDQGRLCAEHETRGRQLYLGPALVIHRPIAEGLCRQNKRGKKNMKRKNPCANEG